MEKSMVIIQCEEEKIFRSYEDKKKINKKNPHFCVMFKG
jgi:hypothetical protein